MSNKPNRKELVEQYKQLKEDAGVYRIVNNSTGQYLLGSTINMRSIFSKFQFAKNTGTATVWLQPLAEEIKQHGYDSLLLEVLELLDIKPETTSAQIKDGVETLEAIWRDKLDPSKGY